MTVRLSVIRLEQVVARAEMPLDEWLAQPKACVAEIEAKCREAGILYDRVEHWNPCKEFMAIRVP
jgi:hypothetical protein